MNTLYRGFMIGMTLAPMAGGCGDSSADRDEFASVTVPLPAGAMAADASSGSPTTGDHGASGLATTTTSMTTEGASTGTAGGSTSTAPVCGDGIIDEEEACDEGPNNGPEGACSVICEINPSACGTVVVAATVTKEPLDVIFVIDNSGSMSSEIEGIQDNINDNFGTILGAAGLDYKVVMVTQYGVSSPYLGSKVCIEHPVGAIPEGGCDDPPDEPGSTDTFRHYSTVIKSTDAWCKILATGVGMNDEFGNYGWMKWLREEAFKAFILVSDDAADCQYESLYLFDNQYDANNVTIAQVFDDALRDLSPANFGDPDAERRYTVHSLVGLAGAYNGEPYLPEEPTVLATCPTADEPGAGHQALSRLTGGLRFPVCDTGHYDKVFKALANSMVEEAKIACEFPVPEAPEGKTMALESVSVLYHAMGNPNSFENFMPVMDAGACATGGFFIADGMIHLCPDTCASVQADDAAQIEIEFRCDPVIPG